MHIHLLTLTMFLFLCLSIDRTSQCTQSLECNEDVIDVRFEMHGNIIAICLEKTGVYLYATESLQLVARLDSPADQ